MDLSIIIPARNEMFLAKTIENILDNIEGDTEVIAICDGNWPSPAIKDHPRVTLIHHSVSIGQRAATNEGARLSQAKFIMKCDAHCAFDKGFDVKMMADCKYEWTMIPRMYNLHAFDWVCDKCGVRQYQGPTRSCPKCEGEMRRDVVWKEKVNPTSDFMRFDADLKFQYWKEFNKRPESKGDIAPTMSLIGACWMMHRERFWELDGMDEEHGSWGQMGTEIACKSWLSGGALMVNKKTWFAHMFRTQGGDFGFPYKVDSFGKSRRHSKKTWFGNEWPKAKYDLKWLIDKFNPPGWEEHDWGENKTKGLVYYTDNLMNPYYAQVVINQIKKSSNGHEITAVGLKPVIIFGHESDHCLNLERGVLAMFKQILYGLEKSTADIVFLVEHDVLYHPSHFNFTPPRKDVFYYNDNNWELRTTDGQALFHHCKRTSGCVAYRELLLEHYRKRVERVEKEGFSRSMGFEPGTHKYPRGVDNYGSDIYVSEFPNVHLRHGTNLTYKWGRFDKKQFRSERSIRGWKLADEIPGWGVTKNRFNEFINEVSDAAQTN